MYESFADIGSSTGTTVGNAATKDSKIRRGFRGRVRSTEAAARLAKYFSSVVISHVGNVSPVTVLTFRTYLLPEEMKEYEDRLDKSNKEREEKDKESCKRPESLGTNVSKTGIKRKYTSNEVSTPSKATKYTSVSSPGYQLHLQTQAPEADDYNDRNLISFENSVSYRVRLINLISRSWQVFATKYSRIPQ